MARWKRPRTAIFDDMPQHLQRSQAGESEETTRERLEWIEGHGLAYVDYFTWMRAKFRPQRVPSRRTGALPPDVAAEVVVAEALEVEAADDDQ